ETAAAGDSVLAHLLLGQLLNGDFGAEEPDHVAANTHFTVAAEAGFAPGEVGIALAYEYGLGMPRDYNSAEIWYRRALAHGYADAANLLDSLARTRAVPLTGPQRALPQG